MLHTSYPIPTHWELLWVVLEGVVVEVELEVEVLDMVDVVVGVLSSAPPNLSTRSSIESIEITDGSSIVAGGT